VRCAELNLPSNYYCGEECMNAHWPKHKEYHKAQKERAEQCNLVGTVLEHGRSLAEAQARRAEETGDEFDKRFAAAMALTWEGDSSNAAAKAWRKLIKQSPARPELYHNLAVVLDRSDLVAEAAPMLLKAMELDKEGTNRWAQSAACAFDLLRLGDCCEVPKPEWWNDEGLKALSAQVVALLPNESTPQAMRAHVLCGSAVVWNNWSAGPRTAAEVKEAATWYRRAAKVANLPVAAQSFNEHARLCDEFADPLLAEEEAKAEAARAAAKAEAAGSRKVAEAKAAVAAQELLAQEEKEKKQAVASTTAGKAKPGKGKKGKAKR